MKLTPIHLSLLLLATFVASGIAMVPTRDLSGAKAYSTGQGIAQDLLRGSVAFEGVIESVSASMGDSTKAGSEESSHRVVRVRPTRWLFGVPPAEATQELIAESRPRMTKLSTGPWTPWEGVDLSPGQDVLVLRQTKESMSSSGSDQSDVLFVTSDVNLIGKVEKLIALHAGIKGDTGRIAELTSAAHGDPLVTGYAATYLTQRESASHPNETSEELITMMADPATPGIGIASITDWLTGTFYRLSPRARNSSIDSLATLAASEDAERIRYGMSGLLRLSQFDVDLRATIPTSRRVKIVERYRQLLATREIASPDLGFEAKIGMERGQ